MKTLKSFTCLFFCLFLGVLCREWIPFPIPEVVYGMGFLLVFLLLKVFKKETVEAGAKGLLDHLAFLFLPLSVSLIDQMDLLGENFFSILITVLCSAALTIGVTAKVIEGLQGLRRK